MDTEAPRVTPRHIPPIGKLGGGDPCDFQMAAYLAAPVLRTHHITRKQPVYKTLLHASTDAKMFFRIIGLPRFQQEANTPVEVLPKRELIMAHYDGVADGWDPPEWQLDCGAHLDCLGDWYVKDLQTVTKRTWWFKGRYESTQSALGWEWYPNLQQIWEERPAGYLMTLFFRRSLDGQFDLQLDLACQIAFKHATGALIELE